MLKMFLRADIAERIGRLYRSGSAPTVQQLQDFKAARAARPKLAMRVAGARPAASAEPENYAVVGSVAQICVEGVLSEEPDFWAWLFGLDGTTYEDIRDAFALAAADPLVKSVILAVSSPGGYCDGLFETLAAIEAFGKPITVQASQACSAAYALAAMAGPITALGPASEFGSIGVACDYEFDADVETVSITSTEAPDKRPDPRTADGKKVIVSYLDDYHELFVDGIARGRSNATGKAYTVEQVNADFGRGAVYLTDDAKAAGMIDKMPRAPKRGSSASGGSAVPSAIAPLKASGGNPEYVEGARVEALVNHAPGMAGMTGTIKIVRTGPPYYGVKFDGEDEIHRWLAEDEIELADAEEPTAGALVQAPQLSLLPPHAAAPPPTTPETPASVPAAAQKAKRVMTKEELKAQHPAVYAEIQTEAVTHERDRVEAHLVGGEGSGDMKTAVEAIRAGTAMTSALQTKYMMAAANRNAVTAHAEDSAAAGAVVAGAAAPVATDVKDNSDLVATAMGLTKKAG